MSLAQPDPSRPPRSPEPTWALAPVPARSVQARRRVQARRPVPLSALVLAVGAMLSVTLFTWLDLRMAEADEVPVDVAPLVVAWSVVAVALGCLLGAAAIGRRTGLERASRRGILPRKLLLTSTITAGLLTAWTVAVGLNVLVAVAADVLVG